MNDIVAVSSPTEDRLAASAGMDSMTTLEVLRLINAEDARVAGAVAATLPVLAQLVDVAVARIRTGGRVHYFGAGTSGRLGVMDAAELLPTFNAPRGMFVAHHAGGAEALVRAVENVEDSDSLGRAEGADIAPGDVVVGLTASGRTPFVAGALTAARAVGASTALITANPAADLAPLADFLIAPDTGPEVITGSTRMKAGTAQKLVLNAFSSAVMIGLGRTYSNLMVDVVATNAKLRGRVIRILCEASGVDEATAAEALRASDGELKTALLGLLAGLPADRARALLAAHDGRVALALAGR